MDENSLVEQGIWRETVFLRLREGDTAEEAVAYANTVVDGFQAKFPAAAKQE